MKMDKSGKVGIAAKISRALSKSTDTRGNGVTNANSNLPASRISKVLKTFKSNK
jgi:hypothetical protein